MSVLVSFPRFVQIQTSNKCNASCTFCPYPYTEAKKNFQLMDWKLYEKIILECSKHKVSQILPFFLNEPLLNKDLVKYIDFAKEKNPDSIIKIFTNGSLLNDKLGRQLLDSKIDEVIISFNGSTKEEYEKFMKPLKYEDTKMRVENFIRMRGERKKPAIAMHILKLDSSPKSVEWTRAFWNSFGVAAHIFKYENRAGNVQNYTIPLNSNVKKIPCSRLFDQIYILVNGAVILCCADWKNEVIFGNLNEKSITEIWNGSERMIYVNAHIREDYNSLKLCNVCNFNEIVVNEN